MKENEKVLELIYRAIDDLNVELSEEDQLKKAPDTILFGNSGALDSLGLVNLIIATEQYVDSDLGVAFTLADERAMSQKSSPFRTVGTLADYILMLLKEYSDAQ